MTPKICLVIVLHAKLAYFLAFVADAVKKKTHINKSQFFAVHCSFLHQCSKDVE